MILPNHRISRQDRDDFVTNLLTVLDVDPDLVRVPQLPTRRALPREPLSPGASGEPVLTLPEIKMHCRIEQDQTVDDEYLTQLEMAARIHTENSLRRPGELDSTAPENIKMAMHVLIAHWYRNREAVVTGSLGVVPLAYDSLLSTERNYVNFY